MGTSDLIARFIMEALDNEEGIAELQRSMIASRFGCVPSQINYVISTRFSPEHGYVVESRRGGGGYIRIKRVRSSPTELIMHAVNAVGDTLDAAAARVFVTNLHEATALDRHSARLILAAVSDSALRPLRQPERDRARASVLKHMLVTAISD
ncbi:MAG: CtsR family transcriptional regulator [Ruminococcaceae bacterium]|nr:CtsR family transcriptional regulator [Oscillospiraceae bacterium]